MEFLPINFALIKSPINWIIVILTVIIGGFALNIFHPQTETDQQGA